MDERKACVDADECALGACDVLVECTNRPGAFACGACPTDHWGAGIGMGSCVARASAAASGSYHTCALLPDGAVKCWGTNLYGELGLGDKRNRGGQAGDMGDALVPVALGARHLAVSLAAGASHTCALLEDGTVKCWGANDLGQLGTGDTQPRGDDPGELGDSLPAVALGAGVMVAALAAGNGHTCALLSDGSIKCWGANEVGQLGLGDKDARGDGPGEMGSDLPALALGSGRRATAIAAGGANTCALLDDGSLKCWGGNDRGQLGFGDKRARGDTPDALPSALPPIALGSGRHATAIGTSGTGHCCALLDNGALECWGANDFGQLGLGDTEDRGDDPDEMGDQLGEVNLGTDRRAVTIAMGGGHGCALLDDGTAKCWGYNGYANLGLGDFAHRGDGPSEMGDDLPALSLGTARRAMAIAPSHVNHTCALLDDGSIKCWGSNGLGQLGQGDLQSRGGRPGEMGDNLPGVNLGHSP